MGLRAGETWRERVRLGTAGRLATIGPDKICTFKSAIYMVRDLLINSPVRQHRAYLASTPNSRNAWVRTQQEGSNADRCLHHGPSMKSFSCIRNFSQEACQTLMCTSLYSILGNSIDIVLS